ncbi:MAG: hypothetical protein H6656_15750 [Ardenticatenaceae bacterium]|nr:hypothetical protein [Ardenticatenaceae bacterium]
MGNITIFLPDSRFRVVVGAMAGAGDDRFAAACLLQACCALDIAVDGDASDNCRVGWRTVAECKQMKRIARRMNRPVLVRTSSTRQRD